MNTAELPDEQRLHDQLQVGFDEADCGEVAEWDLEAFLAEQEQAVGEVLPGSGGELRVLGWGVEPDPRQLEPRNAQPHVRARLAEPPARVGNASRVGGRAAGEEQQRQAHQQGGSRGGSRTHGRRTLAEPTRLTVA